MNIIDTAGPWNSFAQGAHLGQSARRIRQDYANDQANQGMRSRELSMREQALAAQMEDRQRQLDEEAAVAEVMRSELMSYMPAPSAPAPTGTVLDAVPPDDPYREIRGLVAKGGVRQLQALSKYVPDRIMLDELRRALPLLRERVKTLAPDSPEGIIAQAQFDALNMNDLDGYKATRGQQIQVALEQARAKRAVEQHLAATAAANAENDRRSQRDAQEQIRLADHNRAANAAEDKAKWNPPDEEIAREAERLAKLYPSLSERPDTARAMAIDELRGRHRDLPEVNVSGRKSARKLSEIEADLKATEEEAGKTDASDTSFMRRTTPEIRAKIEGLRNERRSHLGLPELPHDDQYDPIMEGSKVTFGEIDGGVEGVRQAWQQAQAEFQKQNKRAATDADRAALEDIFEKMLPKLTKKKPRRQ